MLEILAFTALGVLAGSVTGLLPGLHPNTVIFGSVPFYFDLNIGFVFFGAFISGLSVSHTFHDFIPTIFLGVPGPGSALSALPGQKMAIQGIGKEAFAHTVYGGVLGSIVLIPVAASVYFLFNQIYALIEPFMSFILLFILLLVVFSSDNEFKAAVVAALSGALGILSFEAPVNQQYVLLPIFGGLFAVPSLLRGIASGSFVPEQLETEAEMMQSLRGSILGSAASLPIAVFPGLSNSISTTFLMPLMKSRRQFLAANGAANTSDILLSFVTLLAAGKARSGASVAVRALGDSSVTFLLVATSVFALAISAPISIFSLRAVLGSGLLHLQRKVSAAVTGFIVAVSIYLTSLIGLLILLTASLIGLAAASSSDRHSCMAVLLVPSILLFSGASIFM